jgi:hypothetical protein
MAVQQPYVLRVCDLRSDQTMDLLPITGVSYDDYIGKTGSLSGTIPVPNAATARRIRDVLLPGRTMLYLERSTTFGSSIVWAGILWTRTPTRDARGFWSVPIQAAGLESYFREHRFVGTTVTWTGVDQVEIARELIATSQLDTGANMGIEIDYTVATGVLRTKTIYMQDLARVGKAIDELGALQGGFEWRINCYKDSTGARHRTLQLGSTYGLLPNSSTVGVYRITVGSQDTILSSPGPITAYSLPEDGTLQANTWISRGATVNINLAAQSFPLISGPLTTPADYAAGWPRLDGSSDYTSIDQQALLDAHAQADLAAALRPRYIPSVTVLTGVVDQPALGSYVRLRITDDWYSEGYQGRFRVVGLKVTPEERGRPETTELYLEAA